MKTNRTRPSHKASLLTLLGALITFWTLALQAQAAAPSLMTYQGRLKESGLPVTGTRIVEIAVCPDPILVAGCLATGQQNVSVTNGLFRTTFTASGWDPTVGPWYLEVRVGAAPVALTPREQLTSSPYAIYASSASTLIAATGTAGVNISTHLFIVGASKVGVGTTAPSLNLHISGNNAAAGGDFASLGIAEYGSDASPPEISLNKARGTQAAAANVIVNDALGNIIFAGSEGGVFRSGAEIIGSVGSVGAGVVRGELRFNTADAAGTILERARINVDGNMFLGSGSPATPGDKLFVLGGVSIDNPNASAGQGGLYFNAAGGGHRWDVRLDSINNLSLDFFNTTNGTWNPALTLLNPSGNVGIGTAGPSATLHVSSAATVATTPLLIVSSGTAVGQELLRVRKDGNVGIGTTGPAARLQVTGSAGAVPFIVETNAAAERFRINTEGRIEVSGTTPTLGACAGGGFVAPSNDVVGKINFTAAGAATCVMNFVAPAWLNPPVCVASFKGAGPIEVDTTATSVTFTKSVAYAIGDIISYQCIGRR